TGVNALASSYTEKLSSLSTRPAIVRRCLSMSIAGVSRLLRTNIRSLGVTSKSCSCAGTLPVSGRSLWYSIAGTFSFLISALSMTLAGVSWASASGMRDAATAAATPWTNWRRCLSIWRPSSHLASEDAIREESVAEEERQDDQRSDQHEDERAGMRRGVPDGERVHHHVREEAVGEAGEGEDVDRHRAGEGQGVGFLQREPGKRAGAEREERQHHQVQRAREVEPALAHRLARERRGDADQPHGERDPGEAPARPGGALLAQRALGAQHQPGGPEQHVAAAQRDANQRREAPRAEAGLEA